MDECKPLFTGGGGRRSLPPGAAVFGFGGKRIARLIRSLPNAERCGAHEAWEGPKPR